MEGKKYLKELFLSKIQSISDRQIDDGYLGRLNLNEAIKSYNSLKNQILQAIELIDEDREELVSIIDEKIKEAPEKEQTLISKEEKAYNEKLVAIAAAKKRFDSLNPISKSMHSFPKEDDLKFMSLEEIECLYAPRKENKELSE